MRVKISIALVLLLVGVNAGWKEQDSRTQAAPLSLEGSSDFSVEFTDCVESIGVTLVPTDLARAYLPAQFILVGEGQPVTPLVVRTARCRGVAVNGHLPESGEIVQIGLVIVPPDGTGDINNYTLWYDTSHAHLATRLQQTGVSAQLVPTMVDDYDADDNSLFVRVPKPGTPSLALSGSVQPSLNPAGSFLANWWQQTSAGDVKMSTSVPVINIGAADLTLTTNGSLGQLFGGSSTGFVVLQQFNTFTSAHMEVSVVSP